MKILLTQEEIEYACRVHVFSRTGVKFQTEPITFLFDKDTGLLSAEITQEEE